MRSLFTVSPLRKDPMMRLSKICVYNIAVMYIDHFQLAPIDVWRSRLEWCIQFFCVGSALGPIGSRSSCLRIVIILARCTPSKLKRNWQLLGLKVSVRWHW